MISRCEHRQESEMMAQNKAMYRAKDYWKNFAMKNSYKIWLFQNVSVTLSHQTPKSENEKEFVAFHNGIAATDGKCQDIKNKWHLVQTF